MGSLQKPPERHRKWLNVYYVAFIGPLTTGPGRGILGTMERGEQEGQGGKSI